LDAEQHPATSGAAPAVRRAALAGAEPIGERGGVSARPLELWGWARSNPDLALFGLLLLITAFFSRYFSKGLQVGPLYVTELVMLASGLIAVVRLGSVGEVWRMLRRLPLPALALIWVVGAIATYRGLRDYTFSFVSEDIGLVDYTLVLPLLALMIVDRSRFRALYAILVACGFAGIVAFAVHFFSDHASGHVNYLWPLQGAAAGLYMSFAVIWIVARVVNGVPTSRWLLALVPVGIVLMSLTTQRSVWMIGIVALGAVALLAPGHVRLRTVGAVGGLLVITFVMALGAERMVNATFGDIQDVNQDPTAAGGTDKSQLSTELTSVADTSSTEGENVTWRIAYWKDLIGRTPDNPILGVGFGRPSAFVWNDRKYDFRDGRPGTGIDVAGPHNSFVEFLYRLGIPATLALIAIMLIAARNVYRAFRAGFEDRGERVLLTTLVGMALAGTMSASFNQALTGPFIGLFFWVPLGMLLLWPAASRALPRASA
jgi:O-antigen ligase